MSGRNSRATLNPALSASEVPELVTMLPAVRQWGGPHALDTALAPTTPATLEIENRRLPLACRAVTVASRA